MADLIGAAAAEVAAEIAAVGGTAEHLAVDIADEESARGVVASCGGVWPTRSCSQHAGVSGISSFTADASVEDFDHVVGVDPRGVWRSMKYDICHLLERQANGAIVNTASVGGLIGISGGGGHTHGEARGDRGRRRMVCSPNSWLVNGVGLPVDGAWVAE